MNYFKLHKKISLLIVVLLYSQFSIATRTTPTPPNVQGIVEVIDGSVVEFFVGERDGGDINNLPSIPSDEKLNVIAKKEYREGATYLAFSYGRIKYECVSMSFETNGTLIRMNSTNIIFCRDQIIDLGLLGSH